MLNPTTLKDKNMSGIKKALANIAASNSPSLVTPEFLIGIGEDPDDYLSLTCRSQDPNSQKVRTSVKHVFSPIDAATVLSLLDADKPVDPTENEGPTEETSTDIKDGTEPTEGVVTDEDPIDSLT